MNPKYCVFCGNEAVWFYMYDMKSQPVCSTCKDAMEVGEWYGEKGIYLNFDLLEDRFDEQEVNNES